MLRANFIGTLLLEKAVELDCQWVEFDDIRYHIQGSVKTPNVLLLSVSFPIPPPETILFGGLPLGALEAIKAAYGVVAQILDPPRDGFNLTLKLNLAKLPSDEEQKNALLTKIASVREVVMGAPLRAVLKQLVTRTIPPDQGKPIALVHRPNESFFLVPQADKVTVIFPMRFSDSIDTVLASSFLQDQFYSPSLLPAKSNSTTAMDFENTKVVSRKNSATATSDELSHVGPLTRRKLKTSGWDGYEYFTSLKKAKKSKSLMAAGIATPGGNLTSLLCDELSQTGVNFS
ncbi:Actin-related protein 2/3 complex subunit 2A [Capsicum annuum]|nr:Actin-related protein 2/3 complex subunit 2A [Capsicum annuum]